jgi:hypothetical protein
MSKMKYVRLLVTRALNLYAWSILVFCSTANAFWVGDAVVLIEAGVAEVHQDMTRQALRAVSYSSPVGAVRFTDEMLEKVVTANARTDEIQWIPEYHFDNVLNDGSRRLVDLRKLFFAALTKSEPISLEEADRLRNYLGSALHTLQDFYSHTDWVEQQLKHNPPELAEINHELGRTEMGNSPTPTKESPHCDFRHSIINPRTEDLFSGQAIDPLQLAKADDFECAHGLFAPVLGINKDGPGRQGYSDARRLAVRATTTFVQVQILSQATNVQSVCALLQGSYCRFATQLVASASPSASVVGQSVVLSAVVSISPGQDAPPGITLNGSVIFSENGHVLCTAALLPHSGVGACSTAFSTAGNHTVVARYGGDDLLREASTSLVQTVVQTQSQGFFWRGTAQITKCSIPFPCNFLTYNLNDGFPASIAFRDGGEPLNMRLDQTFGCIGTTVSISPSGGSFTYSLSSDEPAWPDQVPSTITFTTTAVTPNSMSGTISVRFDRQRYDLQPGQGTAEGTWSVTRSPTPFPKCLLPVRRRGIPSGGDTPQFFCPAGSGNNFGCDYRGANTPARTNDWAQ